jgi:hypothetical protein
MGFSESGPLSEMFQGHGEVETWKGLEAIEAELTVGGFLFTTKHLKPLNHTRVRASTKEPRFTFYDFPKPGQRGEFFGDREVSIMEGQHTVLANRVNPRSAFKGLRRVFKWDLLDFVYFGGYATWNYLVSPFLFLRDGFILEEMEPVFSGDGRWSRLRVTFPKEIPTHCRTQIFYFDEERLLRRLDYTAEVIGSWAYAAHFCDLYKEFVGLKFATRRRVRPILFGGKVMPAPTLVAIDVHDVQPVSAQ